MENLQVTMADFFAHEGYSSAMQEILRQEYKDLVNQGIEDNDIIVKLLEKYKDVPYIRPYVYLTVGYDDIRDAEMLMDEEIMEYVSSRYRGYSNAILSLFKIDVNSMRAKGKSDEEIKAIMLEKYDTVFEPEELIDQVLSDNSNKE